MHTAAVPSWDKEAKPKRFNVAWWWYLVTSLVPVVGLVVGIVAAAKDRVGPALALWMTAFCMTFVWVGLVTGIAAASALNNSPVSYYQGGDSYTDDYGYKCNYTDTDYNNHCPSNPLYKGDY